MKKSMLTSTLLAASFLLASPAMAEQASTPPKASAPASQASLPDATDFSEQQLQAFVDSQKQMGQIQQNYSRKLQAKKDNPTEAAAIQQEARQALATAVQDSGLEVKTYNQIAMLARNDAEFRAKLQAML